MPSKSDQKEEFVDHVDPLESRTSARGWKIRVPLPPRCDDKLRDFHREGGQFRRSKQQRTHEERKKKKEKTTEEEERKRERKKWKQRKKTDSWKTRVKREKEEEIGVDSTWR